MTHIKLTKALDPHPVLIVRVEDIKVVEGHVTDSGSTVAILHGQMPGVSTVWEVHVKESPDEIFDHIRGVDSAQSTLSSRLKTLSYTADQKPHENKEESQTAGFTVHHYDVAIKFTGRASGAEKALSRTRLVDAIKEVWTREGWIMNVAITISYQPRVEFSD